MQQFGRVFLIPFTVVLAIAATFAGVPAFGTWARQPLETRLIESDLVVIGKMTTIKEGPAVNHRPYSLGEVQVEEVLKGKAGPDGSVQSVQVIFPAKLLVASDIVFQTGVQGIWILRQDDEADYYWANYAGSLQPMGTKEQLAKTLHHQAELKWGPDTNGMRLLCKGQVVPDVALGGVAPKPGEKGYNAPGVPALQAFIQNVSDKPRYVCDWGRDEPINFDIQDAQGKPFKIDVYNVAWRGPLTKASFLHLRPGQVRAVGGVPGAFRLPGFPEAGQYTITAVFTAKNEGKQFKLTDAWTGTIKSNSQKVGYRVAPPGQGG